MSEKKFDISAVIAQYGDDDFGFTAIDEGEYESVIAEKEETVEEYKQRLQQVEKIVLPFLTKLLQTANQPVIKWPNRGPIIEAQIQKILNLTRD